VKEQPLALQLFSADAPMAIEHAGQPVWEQAAVGALCALGGGLLAYWSLQGVVGLIVITLCVTFSTLVTTALSYYYDHVAEPEEERPQREAAA
jgi:hypothetical protein